MANTKIDDRIRALFKEWARKIVVDDRAARKYGPSQNTIGVMIAQMTALGSGCCMLNDQSGRKSRRLECRLD